MSVSKEIRDPFYGLAKKEGYRARSAYKLIHIDKKYKILENIKNVVDLCSAPGSWSQVLSKRIGNNGKILSIDIQKIEPIDNVYFIQEDITTESCKEKILSYTKEKIDLVIFDGAPEVTGVTDIDEYQQTILLKNALFITVKILKIGGTFVGKCFRSENTGYIIKHFRKFFHEVLLIKPESSRESSSECFLLCREFFEASHDPLFLDVDCDPDPNILIRCKED